MKRGDCTDCRYNFELCDIDRCLACNDRAFSKWKPNTKALEQRVKDAEEALNKVYEIAKGKNPDDIITLEAVCKYYWAYPIRMKEEEL